LRQLYNVETDTLLRKIYTRRRYYEIITDLFKTDEPRIYVLKLARDLFDEIPTYAYEDCNVNIEKFKNNLLANLIAERIVLVREKRRFKHVTISIVGMAGSGKTTYAIMSLIGALIMVGISPDEAVKIADSLTFFDARDFTTTIKEVIEEKRWIPAVIFDDVGAQISKYWITLGEKYWTYFFSLLDQVKEFIGTLILTARSFSSIPARMRELSDLVVDAEEILVGDRVVDLFRYYRLDDYSSKRRKEENLLYIDVLAPCVRMPDGMWKRMLKARRELSKKRLEHFSEEMEVREEMLEEKLEKIVEKKKKKKEEKADENDESSAS